MFLKNKTFYKVIHPLLITIFINLIYVLVYSQELNAQTPGVSGINVFIHRITTEQGLSNPEVYAIIQDMQGFIWIGTAYGLNRFDGENFTMFLNDPNDTTSLSDSFIWSLYVDREGTLWVGTQYGLNKFNPITKTFKRYFHNPDNPKSLSNNEIRSFCEDRAGVFWVGTARGLNRFDRTTETWTSFLPTPNDSTRPGDNFVNAILEDHKGNFWIGTGNFLMNGGGLHKFDRSNESFTHYWYNPSDPMSLSDNWVTSLLEDRSGTLWVTADAGDVNKFNNASGNFTHLHLHDERSANLSPGTLSIKCIREDNLGALWIATWGWGLFRYDRRTGTYIQYIFNASNSGSLSNLSVNTLYIDRAGLLWVGANRGGVSTFATKPFLHQHTVGESLQLGSRVDGLFTDNQGNLWIGDVGSGLWRFDPVIQRIKHVLPDGTGIKMYQDNEGTIWICNTNEVIKYNLKTGTSTVVWNVPYRHSSQEWISSMLLDRERFLWVGTNGGSLYRIEKNLKEYSLFIHDPNNPQSIAAGQINSMLQDRSGTIWVGTGEGLNQFDKESQTFTRFIHDERDSTSLSSDYWCSLFEDRSGTLWVGTADGLNRFNNESSNFSRFFPADHQQSRFVNLILEDNSGRFWYASGSRIFMFDPATSSFKSFDESDGLEHVDVLGWSLTKLKSGEFVFGTANGIVVFNPDSVKTSGYIPPIVITGMKKFYQSINFTSLPELVRAITFEHEDNVFSIEYAALSYDMPSFNQYAYKLEGFDKDWVYCGNRREVTYTNLDPGVYTFFVKGSNHDGVWNETGASIKIIINPPWWKTWWFLTFFWVTVAGSIGGTLRYVEKRKLQKKIERLERERALEKERVRISQDMHDEVGSSLSEISILSELLKRDMSQTEEAEIHLRDISERSSEVIENIGQIIWAINPRNDPLDNLVAHLRLYAADYIRKVGIKYRFEIPDNIPAYQLSAEVRRNVFLVVKEALHNIVQHSCASEVKVRVDFLQNQMVINVKDNGKGFSIDQISGGGNGLINMQKRIENIGGIFKIDSEAGKGTSITITVNFIV
jgi:ligand-binding sensor domain-containing protein/signal transduction histidine kinase